MGRLDRSSWVHAPAFLIWVWKLGWLGWWAELGAALELLWALVCVRPREDLSSGASLRVVSWALPSVSSQSVILLLPWPHVTAGHIQGTGTATSQSL